LFGVVDRQFFAKTDLRDSFVHNSSGYMVVEGDFVSVADEKSQRLHIYADDHGES